MSSSSIGRPLGRLSPSPRTSRRRCDSPPTKSFRFDGPGHDRGRVDRPIVTVSSVVRRRSDDPAQLRSRTMSDGRRRPRLLVFVIAYYAESTLTLGAGAHPAVDLRRLRLRGARRRRRLGRPHVRDRPRVPAGAPGDPDDGAAQRAQPGLRRQPEGRLRLRHRARASTSSRWCTATASTRRRSCRALVAPLRDGQADAVFGSRMMTAFGALQGRHAALQVRGQPDPHRACRTAAAAPT